MVSMDLHLVGIPPPLPIGIFTDWIVIISLSRALNLAFDWTTFSNSDHITLGVISSFLQKLIPIALSYTLTSLLIVIPNISELLQFCKAYSNRSDTLARKWDIGFEFSLSYGCKRRTISLVPTALNRLYCLFISSSVVNLGSSVSSMITLQNNLLQLPYIL
jgi:hypothetical protein